MSSPQYKRILLKLSGEALKGKEASGVDPDILNYLLDEISEVHHLGVQIGIVIGGGNYFRGAQAKWMDRAAADYVGMMATIMNALTIEEACRQRQLPCTLFSSHHIEGVVQKVGQRALREARDAHHIIIFAGGTGHPFFSTDTAAALRAHEMGAELLIKATQVDGVYDDDPKKNPNARRFESLSYINVLEKNLRVMDATSISFCREYSIPILVFNVSDAGQLKKAVLGEPIGTLITSEERLSSQKR